MGNVCGRASLERAAVEGGVEGVKAVVVPSWKSNEPLTREDLEAKREQFWDTQPYYGGNKGMVFVS